MRTVVGVLPTVEDARKMAHEFEKKGIARNEINVVSPAPYKEELKKVRRSKRTDAKAALQGAVRGALFGFVLVGALLLLPGVTPFIAGSAIMTLGAVAIGGAIIIGLMVMMENMGQPHEEAALYAEAVREKGVVLAAHVKDEVEAEVVAELRSHGARDVHPVRERYEHSYPCDSTITAG